MDRLKLVRVVVSLTIGLLAVPGWPVVQATLGAPAPQSGREDSVLKYLPPDPNIVVRIRLGEIAKLEKYQPIVKMAEACVAKVINLPASEIEELWLVSDASTGFSIPTWSQCTGYWGVVVRAHNSFSVSPPNPEDAPKLEEIPVGDKQLLFVVAARTAWAQLDSETAVIGNRSFVEAILSRMFEKPPAVIAAKSWRDLGASHVLIGCRGKSLASLLYSLADLRREGPLVVSALAPMWNEALYYHVGVHCADKLSVAAIAESKDAATATDVQQTMSSAVILTKNVLTGPPAMPWPGVEPREPSPFSGIAAALLTGAKVDQPLATTVRLRCSAINPQDLVKSVTEVADKALAGATRNLSANNLKQIALAMHQHHDVFKRLPGAAAPGKADGPPVSWRVRILPYLGEVTLYNQYKKDEPWDSEANRQVLEKMPVVFRAPGDDPKSTNAGYYAVVGEKTVFGIPKGANFKDIVDGTSKTILVVEAKRDIPWTKPEDIPYDAEQSVPSLGGWQENGFFVALVDGSVHFLPNKVNEKVLKTFLARASRMPKDLDVLKAP